METIIDNQTPPESHLKLVTLIQQGADIDDLLSVISKDQNNPFHSSLATLLRQKNLNVTVKLADTNSPFCGQYEKEQNQYTGIVSINPACQEMGFPVSQILLHECIHSATYSAVRSGTKEAEIYKKRLSEIKTHARKELIKKGVDPENYYGLNFNSHVEELITEIFTDSQLRELLQNIPAKPIRGKKLTETIQTMYDQIIEVVNNIIGGKEQDHPVVKEIMEIGAGLMVIDEKIQIAEMLDESKQFTYQTSFLKNLLREERNLNPTDNPFEAHLLNISYPNAKLYNDYMNKYNGNPIGIEFQYGKESRYAFTVPDVIEPGKFRVSYFDERGFSSHQTFNTLEESFEEMIKSGYHTEVKGKLSELSIKPEFEIGNRVSTLIGELNSGKISHKEFVELRNAIHNELLPKKDTIEDDSIRYTSENVYIMSIEKQLIDTYNQKMLEKDSAHTSVNDINDNSIQNWKAQGNNEEMWFDYRNMKEIEKISQSYLMQFAELEYDNENFSQKYDDLKFEACEELRKYGVMINTDETLENFAQCLKNLPVQESISGVQINIIHETKEITMSDQFITEREIAELFRNNESNAKSMVIEAEKEVVESINNYDYYRGYAKGMEGLIDKVENKESLTTVINEVQMLTNQYNMHKSHGEETPSFPAKQENTQFLKGQIHGIVDGVKTLRDINIGKFIDETPGLAAKPIPDYPALTGEEKHEYKDFVTVMRKNFPNAKIEDLNKLCTIAHEMNQNTLKNANGTLSEEQHSIIMEKEVSQIKAIMGDTFKGAGVSLDYEANHPAIRLELPKGHTNDKTGTYSVPEIPMHKLTIPNANSIIQTQIQTAGRSR